MGDLEYDPVPSQWGLGHLLVFAATVLVGGAILLCAKAYAIYAGTSSIQQIMQHVASNNKRTGTVVGVHSLAESWGPFIARFAAEMHLEMHDMELVQLTDADAAADFFRSLCKPSVTWQLVCIRREAWLAAPNAVLAIAQRCGGSTVCLLEVGFDDRVPEELRCRCDHFVVCVTLHARLFTFFLARIDGVTATKLLSRCPRPSAQPVSSFHTLIIKSL
jgi:hypothetical protein